MRGRFIILLLCVAALALGAAPAAWAAAIDVTDITPDVGGTGTTVECIVYGAFNHPINQLNFEPEFTLSDGLTTIDGYTAWFDNAGGTRARVLFDIPDSATLGLYDLFAHQTVGLISNSDVLLDAFLVEEVPVIDWLDPASLSVGPTARTIIVHGRHFWGGFGASQVLINGSGVPTSYHSSTVLHATVSSFVLSTQRVLRVQVVNPGFMPGGNVYSNEVLLPVYAPPTITSISPATAAPGGPAFTLEVNGANFNTGMYGSVVVWMTQSSSGGYVFWGSSDLATVRDSSTHLRATVPAALIARAGTATIAVRNGGVDAPVSNGVTFTIIQPTPVLASIAPTSVWAGYVKNDIVLSVAGSNFLSGAHIALNGIDKTTTTFVGATQLTVPLAAADIATPGTVNVSVKNPPFPPGYPSASSLPLAVQAETTTPQVSIGGADSLWHNAPVLLSFAATDSQSGIQKVQYMSTPAVSSWTVGTSYTVPTTTQGAVTVNVQALDWCNTVGTASATVNIDATQPRTRTLDDASVTKGHNARLKFRVEEPSGLSPQAAVTIKILRSDGSTAKKLDYPSVPVNSDRVAGFECNLRKGTYKWYVYATDLAGNTQANIAHARLTVK